MQEDEISDEKLMGVQAWIECGMGVGGRVGEGRKFENPGARHN